MHSAFVVGLNAVIVAVTDEQPRVLTVKRAEFAAPPDSDAVASPTHAADALPFALFDPDGDRTLELGVRDRVRNQTGLELGYVEQLYTFGDRNRLGEHGARILSIAYLGLSREEAARLPDARWCDCYDYFPWEDWRDGAPAMLEESIYPALQRWIDAANSREQREARRERAAIVFGWGNGTWDGERVLERYELLYELGMVTEHHRDRAQPGAVVESTSTPGQAPPADVFGRWMALDHRRILSTALGRIRGKIKYRPVVFELLPDTFTLFYLQRVVEALAGIPLHKQNFRRLMEKGGLVEATGETDTQTGGRPAALFRFRREVLRERPSSGVGLPGTSGRSLMDGQKL